MLIKRTLFLTIGVCFGLAISPSYSGDIISCSSFENCPDGSEDLTNKLIQLENKIDALEALLAGVSRGVDPDTSQDTLTFTNMNVQVVSGSGNTASFGSASVSGGDGKTASTDGCMVGDNGIDC